MYNHVLVAAGSAEAAGRRRRVGCARTHGGAAPDPAPATDAVNVVFEASRADAGAAERLAAALDELRTRVTEHLDDEEAHTFALVDAALDDKEFGSFERASAKGVALRGAAQFFPWVLEGADPEDAEVALEALPPPIRVLCRRRWIPRYERRIAVVWPD